MNDNFDTPNVWIFFVEGIGHTRIENNDPESPLSILSRGREVVDFRYYGMK